MTAYHVRVVQTVTVEADCNAAAMVNWATGRALSEVMRSHDIEILDVRKAPAEFATLLADAVVMSAAEFEADTSMPAKYVHPFKKSTKLADRAAYEARKKEEAT